MLLATDTRLVTYPVLVLEVEGGNYRALIDTGLGSSYASSKLINKVNKKAIRRESKRTDTLMHSVVNPIQDEGAKRPPYQFFSCNLHKRRN